MVFRAATLFFSLPLSLATAAPAATPQPSLRPSPSPVRFVPLANEGFVPPSTQEAQEPCALLIQETANPRPDELVLGGRIRCPSLGSRSLLLRSTDRGATWKETAPAFVGKGIAFLKFLNSRFGYALAAHREEGPGPDTLLITQDGGRTWSARRELPKGDAPHLAVVSSLQFSSPTVGNFSILVTTGAERDLSLKFATSDGGRVWEFSRAQVGSPQETPPPSTTEEWTIAEEEALWILLHRNPKGERQPIATLRKQVGVLEVASAPHVRKSK